MQFFLKHLFCICSAVLWVALVASLVCRPYAYDGKVSDTIIVGIGALLGVLYILANAVIVLVYSLCSKTLCYEKHADALIAALVNSSLLIIFVLLGHGVKFSC